jgi:hypothetical protein
VNGQCPAEREERLQVFAGFVRIADQQRLAVLNFHNS